MSNYAATKQDSGKKYDNGVFVSYAWGGESERVVNELEKAFAVRGIKIIRDKKDNGYKQSIGAFEQRIAHGHCIILVISDKYLRSEHCMYELVEADKNRNLRDRIFPIVLKEARIYRHIDRLEYINHWDKEIEQLNQGIKNARSVANISGITAGLNKYADIRASIDHLTDLLSDMNTLSLNDHVSTGFSILINAVEKRIKNTFIDKREARNTTPANQTVNKTASTWTFLKADVPASNVTPARGAVIRYQKIVETLAMLAKRPGRWKLGEYIIERSVSFVGDVTLDVHLTDDQVQLSGGQAIHPNNKVKVLGQSKPITFNYEQSNYQYRAGYKMTIYGPSKYVDAAIEMIKLYQASGLNPADLLMEPKQLS